MMRRLPRAALQKNQSSGSGSARGTLCFFDEFFVTDETLAPVNLLGSGRFVWSIRLKNQEKSDV